MAVDHYENFPVASFLLPRRLHAAVTAIYRFARSADDLADEGNRTAEQRLAELSRYRAELDALERSIPSGDAVFQALAPVVAEHRLPIRLLRDLLDAFSQDVVQQRYATFDELLDYCRRSANPVGRLMLCLYREERPRCLEWSDAICTALQLINHWQDVAIDWKKSRVYLPQEDLQRFAVAESHIAQALVDDGWIRLMRFQTERARALMLSGAPLARALPGRIGFELRLVVCGGLRILEKIEQAGCDVFRRRPWLGKLDWPLLLWRALFRFPPA